MVIELEDRPVVHDECAGEGVYTYLIDNKEWYEGCVTCLGTGYLGVEQVEVLV